MGNLWATEPVAVVAFVGAMADVVLAALIAFGLPITGDQKLALQAVVTVAVTGISALIARGQVQPVVKGPSETQVLLSQIPPRL